MSKVSKRSVNYRKASGGGLGFWGKRCRTCSMFRPNQSLGKLGNDWPGSCTLVEGRIRGNDVCDRWEAK